MQKQKIQPSMIVVFILLLTILLWLQYKLWIENHSISQLWHLKQDLKAQQQENATLQDRNLHLQDQVQHLKKNTQAIEEEARKQLGMVKQDETFYRIVDDQ